MNIIFFFIVGIVDVRNDENGEIIVKIGVYV